MQYRAVIDWIDPATPVDGCDCDWKGTAGEADEIGSACLTPGDPSPAGRCPACGCLVYPAGPRAMVAGDLMHWNDPAAVSFMAMHGAAFATVASDGKTV